MAIQIKKSTLKKNKKAAPNGVAHIQSTFNNTIVTITSVGGETICVSFLHHPDGLLSEDLFY